MHLPLSLLLLSSVALAAPAPAQLPLGVPLSPAPLAFAGLEAPHTAQHQPLELPEMPRLLRMLQPLALLPGLGGLAEARLVQSECCVRNVPGVLAGARAGVEGSEGSTQVRCSRGVQGQHSL